MQATVHVSSAELLNIATVPKLVIPAPGPNKVIILLGYSVSLDWVFPNYVGGDTELYIGPITENNNLTNQITLAIHNGVSLVGTGTPVQARDNSALYADQPVTLNANVSPTAGGGALTITAVYAIGDTA